MIGKVSIWIIWLAFYFIDWKLNFDEAEVKTDITNQFQLSREIITENFNFIMHLQL